MLRRHALPAALAALVIAGCGDDPLDACCRRLESVEVSPPTANLAVGDSVRFTATVRDEDGVIVETPVTWAVVTGARGSINAAGWFRASTPGTSWIRGTITAGLLVDSALVTVTAAP